MALRMRIRQISEKPFLLFLPFLLGYIGFVLALPSDGLRGDEPRYLMYARNILNGFYSPQAPNIALVNGPGYPLFLVPFVALRLPMIAMTLANAFLYYFSTILLYKTLRQIVPQKTSMIFGLFWASYFVAFWYSQYVYTESLTYFFVCLFAYYLVKAFYFAEDHGMKKYWIFSGLALGYLALIKIAFVYVIFFLLLGALVLWAFDRKNMAFGRLSKILGVSILVLLPYLIYCYLLTDKILYFNTNTGDTLYWMSSPYEQEYGDWQYDSRDFVDRDRYISGSVDTLRAHHLPIFEEVSRFEGIEKDQALKRIAIKNIRNYPFSYIKNCFYNAGRLFFDYPYSYRGQSPWALVFITFHAFLLAPFLLSFIITIRNWRKVPLIIRFLLFIPLLYLGESVLVSATIRMFTPVVPLLIIWVAYILQRAVKIEQTLPG